MRHETGYQHWTGEHLGIWLRRAVIAAHGMRACLQVKWMRYLVTLCWGLALIQVAALFFLGQLLVADSIAVQWLSHLSGQLQTIGKSLTTWLEEHPEISVRTTYNVLFYFFTSNLLTLTLVAGALAIPHLITRDLASRAIVIYSSKAIGRFDYLLGKFSTVFGLMFLTWLGPAMAAWFLGNLLSTHWHFFWHSRVALGHVLLYALSGMLFLSILALGVSSISSQARSSVSLWVALWILGSALVPISTQTKPWLKYLSFRYDLQQVSLAIFNLRRDFDLAQENIPIFGQLLRGVRRESAPFLQDPELAGAIWGLSVMALLAVLLIWRKVKPE